MNWFKRHVGLGIAMVFGLVVGLFVPWPWKALVFSAWVLGLCQSWYVHRNEKKELLKVLTNFADRVHELTKAPDTKPGRSNKRP